MRNKCYRILIALFLVSGSHPHYAQQNPDLSEKVLTSIEKRVKDGNNPSIAIGIIDENGSRFYNFGLVRKEGKVIDEHTIYEIGSITKVFTAILLAQQVGEGRISLTDPIQPSLPEEVKVPRWETKEITFGNLTDHTSSLPRMPSNFTPASWDNPYSKYSVHEMYAFLSEYELRRPIGSKYEYSNLAQGLLGHILALKTGMSYESLMVQRIAKPLGMFETSITLNEQMQANLAIGHNFGKEVSNWDIPDPMAGAGAIRSSTSDMIKFLEANLGYSDTSLRSAMDLSHAVRHDMAGKMSVAMGWHVMEGSIGDVIWHNGGTGGYRAFAGFVKESGKGVVVLTNSAGSVDDIGFHLLDPEFKLKR